MIIFSGCWTPTKKPVASTLPLLLFPAESDGIAETAVAPINVEWVENVGADEKTACGPGIYHTL